MCTVLAFQGNRFLFGRNMDIEYSFGERIVVAPRAYPLHFCAEKEQHSHYAMLGMAAEGDFPLYAEAFNERGLCAAGLNFPVSAVYSEILSKTKHNVAPHEMIAWVLGQCETVLQAQELLNNTTVVVKPYKNFPIAPLHWIFADRTRCIVAEPREGGLRIYENPVGVLTNEPPFDVHLCNLNQYLNLTARFPENRFGNIDLSASFVGAGAVGLPGDASSPSRFVRAAFGLHNSGKEEGIPQIFHLLSSVEMVRGSVFTKSGKPDYTRYSCCIDGEEGLYFLRTYDALQVQTFSMRKEELNGNKLVQHTL